MKRRDPAAHLAKLRQPKSEAHKQKIRDSSRRYWQEAKAAERLVEIQDRHLTLD